jgi:hypothetical protein
MPVSAIDMGQSRAYPADGVKREEPPTGPRSWAGYHSHHFRNTCEESLKTSKLLGLEGVSVERSQ